MIITVYFGSKKVGSLFSTDNRGVVFQYSAEYVASKDAVALSLSLPLRNEEFSQKECMPFFAGLLPEEDSRKRIADYLHISETSTLKLLEALGGECAGLITITNEENPELDKRIYEFNSENYEELSDDRIAEYIRKMPERPLIKADEKLRLSLAGAQEKLSLAKINGKWYLPLNGAPSTHILKPTRNGSLETLADNEYICMKIASGFGIDVPNVDLIEFSGKKVFIIQRYDRLIEGTSIKRLHQEDFCQALGLMSEQKYESDGGPGITTIQNLIKKRFSRPIIDQRAFFNMVAFNFLVGNCDSHGKNYSVLYKNGLVQLAPMYDAVSTCVYSGLADKLSMKIGNHFELGKVSRSDFDIVCENCGVSGSVFEKIFKTFKKASSSVEESLLTDEKINRELCAKIFDGIRSRIGLFF
ncbi:MAG: type II toxin-antitoxin system HipA family toxin [Treponema sp.]|nr:type II toxin-antitoxin system HipA family toxin [Candidatus Treponema equifaecale]